jgi:phosphate transport system permease protein
MTTPTLSPPGLSIGDLRGSVRRRRKETAVRTVFLVMALLSIVISAGIVLSLVGQAWTFLTKVELSSLWSSGWFPRDGDFDIRTIVIGSIVVTVIAMLVAGPVGLASAIYLSEYATPRTRRIVKPVLEILAGVPSVVLGFFALTFIAPEIMQQIFSNSPQANLAVAGLGVGILTIPLVASISEDAMKAVPDSLREASYGMGAKRATTCMRVVIPAAVSGLVAAFIISISRAIGETMVVFIAAGGGNGSFLHLNPLDASLEPGLTMTAAMATQASGTDAVKGAGPTFESLFFVGFLLFLITLSLNLVAGRFVARVRQKY